MTLLHSRQRSALKLPANIAAISALTLALAACQTTPLSSGSSLANNADNNNAMQAKKTIADTWQKQRTRTYAYETTIEVSNQNYQAALAAATPQQLAMADSVESHCEYVHDQAYVALMTQAEAQGLEADNEIFTPQRNTLKANYLDCDKQYRAWDEARGNSVTATDATWYDDDEEASQVDDTAEAVAVAATETVDAAYERPYLDVNREPLDSANDDILPDTTYSADEADAEELESEFLPDYDNTHTRLSVKKAKLLEAYLLKPMSISAQGVYKPLAGVITVLPIFQYQTRNHVSAINQPIYIDARNGDIYLWADNFALAISESLDDKLGTTWQNKWLKLSLNDGTLPAGFGRDLIKSHFTALDKSLELAPMQEFKFISPAQLKTLTPPLAPKQLPIMLTAKTIASQEQSYSSNEEASHQYLSTLYEQITQKYPNLVTQEAAGATESTAYTNDLDDQSVDADMDAVNTDDADGNESESMFTSKAIVKQVLGMIKSYLEEMTTTKAEAEEAAAKKVPASAPATTTTIQYAKVSAVPTSTLPTVQYLYGYDSRGQLVWKLQRAQLPKENSLGVETGEGITVDALTHYKALSAMPMAYPNLPAQAQMPSSTNSVDIKTYAKSLNEYYESGEGTEIGKTIFSMLTMYKSMARAKMQGGGSDYDDADEAELAEDAAKDSVSEEDLANEYE